jgi:hypothetical protein
MDCRYFISSATLDARRAAAVVRGHLAIESSERSCAFRSGG